MQTTQRVRGILINTQGKLLLIRRMKPGREAYWVFPGGGMEELDGSLEAALTREVLEELAASIDIKKLVFVQERTNGDQITRESFFLGVVADYNFDQRSGPEFSDPT